MLKHLHKSLWVGILSGTPFMLFAQLNANKPANANELLNNIGTYVINPIIYVLFSAAFVVFVWGIVQFVANLDNEEARSTGGQHILWGLIGMAIMAGVGGIMNIIQNTIMQLGG